MTVKMFAGAAALAALIATPAIAQTQQQQFAGPGTAQVNRAQMQQQQQFARPGTTQVNRAQQVRIDDSRADVRARSYDERRAGYRAGAYDERLAAQRGYDYYDNRRSGFWPGAVAAGVVGGAVGTAGAIAGGAIGTAGAIATAPFRPFTRDSYAYYGDSTLVPTAGAVPLDPFGPKCVPGEIVILNGQQMLCQ